MCGIVCYFGRSNGVNRVLDALDLLSYRAPDSSGIAIIGDDGRFAVRRAVGTSKALRQKIAESPLPSLLPGDQQVVMGHGRWAMVGAVTEVNAHPLSDRGQQRVVCENGSHNAKMMLGAFAEQEHWWRARGVADGEPVHRSKNTTEVIAYEWERLVYQLAEGEIPDGCAGFLKRLDKSGITDPEERALRLAAWRLHQGNAHACAYYTLNRPGTLYISSHNKPIAIARRHFEDGSCDIMVASDINAALLLWSKEEVEAARRKLTSLQHSTRDFPQNGVDQPGHTQEILKSLQIDVIFLDHELHQGEQLFATIENIGQPGHYKPQVLVSRYDGTHIPAMGQKVFLNPTMVGKRGYPSYTESHIAEIPDVMEGIVRHYVKDGQIKLDSVWQDGQLLGPGLNRRKVVDWYGQHLNKLDRLLLIGEGSSWRNAQAAAPLFRHLLPGIVVNVYRPVEVLNLGKAIDAIGDLAIEISWSGTTDSLLKVDSWLADAGVKRLAITGRPQSDLGRRTAANAGTIDVLTGVEVSVATVKGYQAILMTLYLLGLQLAATRGFGIDAVDLAQLVNVLSFLVPRHVRRVIEDGQRRERLHQVARRCRLYNKVVVVGNSPVNIEGELKIEELAQIVARSSDFHAASLRPLIERCALVDDDRRRILFVINATTAEAQRDANYIMRYLKELGIFCLVHTTAHDQLAAWHSWPEFEIFESPLIHEYFQPLIDAPFFFDFAVAMAYARGLSAEDIDRPRNLAKSVTVTGAERRDSLEGRSEFTNVSLAEFCAGKQADQAWDSIRSTPSRAAMAATSALRSALPVISEPLPQALALLDVDHLVLLTDAEATENGVRMAAGAWQMLLGVDVTSYRRFIHELGQTQPGTTAIRFIRAGAFLAIRDAQTIALPSDFSPRQLELLSAVYTIGLAIRLARHRGSNTGEWEAGLARIPLIAANILEDRALRMAINKILAAYVEVGYDKVQIIGGGLDNAAALSIARSLRARGFLAEALYTDSAWHGPLATVGGPDAEHDTLIVILATDPLFQSAAMVDTQVYRTRNAKVILLVPEGNQDMQAVHAVGASAVVAVPAIPRAFLPLTNALVGSIMAEEFAHLWEEKESD